MTLDFIDKPINPPGPYTFTVVSTFAGCGGSSLGYKWAGGKVLAAIEWDKNAVETYRLNHHGTPVLHRDIATVTVDELLEVTGLQPGELDIFDGSPPCQGFSTAGKRVMDDPRNQLFREYVRLLAGLRPKVFVMENVSGMVKGKMKLVFVEILKELKAQGYKVSARLLNAMYFGVPQSRQRMIFIGVRDDLGIEPSHPNAETRPITVKESIGCVASFHNSSFSWKPMTDRPFATLTKTRSRAHLVDYEMRPISDRAQALWHKIPIGKNGTSVSGPNKDFSLFKLHPSRPCPTVCKEQTAGQGIMHWAEPRYLSAVELGRVGSFPDAFLWGSTENAVARIGNSVPPRFMQSIAEHIYATILARVD